MTADHGAGAGPPSRGPGRRSRVVTDADRADWEQWSRDRAQEAFRRGRELTAARRDRDALRWLERARRLAPEAPAVAFPLAMARLSAGDPHGAASVLRPLLRRYDFREGWVALAASCAAAGRTGEAATALGRTLSRDAPDPAVFALMGRIATAAGFPGWCGLRGDGTLLVDGETVDRTVLAGGVVARLDGTTLRAARHGAGLAWPADWRGARELRVTRGGADLLGSPVSVAAVLRLEGFVEAVDGTLRGWAWHPGEPERDPELVLHTAAGDRIAAVMRRPSDAISADTPLARPRLLDFPPVPGLDDGPVSIRDPAGRELSGSPLDPGLELRAAAAAALVQARATTRNRATAAAKHPDPMPPFLPVAAALVGRSPAVSRRVRGIDVVVPVYRHRQRTMDCLNSVLATVPAGTGLVVVEDASPEPELCAALDEMAATTGLRLIRRARNGGFPASANDGLAASAGRDVVLLNSDTLVAPGWLEALRRAAYAAPDIGTATPFSNDASILNYPRHRDVNPAPDGADTARLMALAADANGDAVADIPTGNGFCLFVRRDCLDQVGLLREDLFAQGYGEENDFCLRARHLGWRHVAALGVFVSHHGNTSFGPARTELMRRNLEILNRLHPGYDALIAAHIVADPLREARRRFDIARWTARRHRRGAIDAIPRAALLITHDQGGGVEKVVRERARLLRARGVRPVVLRPVAGREGAAVALSEGDGDQSFANLRFDLPGEFDGLCALLEGEGVQHGEWHHLLGHHPVIRELCDRLGVPFDVFVHDYAAFCQRIALVGPSGRYCGEPDPAGCERCIAAQGSVLFEEIGVPAMLQRSAAEFARARRVVAPSRDAAARIARHFSGVRASVEPWEDDRPDLSLDQLAVVSSQAPRLSPRPASPAADPGARPMRIAVIGGIGREKGFDLLRACLDEIRARALPLEFVVIGHTPDDAALIDTGSCFVTGEYGDEEAVTLIAAQDADLVLLPSIWPETWCFTLSLAWRAGLKVAAFDIGAPAERIRRTGRGVLLPLGLPVPDLVDVLLRLGNRQEIVVPRPAVPGGTIAERRAASHHRGKSPGNG